MNDLLLQTRLVRRILQPLNRPKALGFSSNVKDNLNRLVVGNIVGEEGIASRDPGVKALLAVLHVALTSWGQLAKPNVAVVVRTSRCHDDRSRNRRFPRLSRSC